VSAAGEAPRGFEARCAGAWTVFAVPEVMDEACAYLRDRPVAKLVRPATAPGSSGKPASGRGATVEMKTAGGLLFVIKILRKGGLGARARGAFHGRARLAAEMEILAEAVRRGIPTSRPAFGATARMADGRVAAALATEKIPDAATLAALLAEPPARRGIVERRGALARAGEAVRAAHDRGLDHADLNAGNILVSLVPPPDSPGAWVIDLGVSKLGSPLGASRRAANLVRLLRSVEKHAGRDPGRLRDAVAFLRGYVGRAGGEARRTFRSDLLRSVKRRLPAIALHRIGWSLSRRGSRKS